jgi:hypothetical protein
MIVGAIFQLQIEELKFDKSLKVTVLFGAQKIKAKTIHYKKKKGKWRRRRAWITAKVLGESVNVNCLLPANQNKSKNQNISKNTRKRKMKAKVTSSGQSNNWYKTKQLQLNTLHARIVCLIQITFMNKY